MQGAILSIANAYVNQPQATPKGRQKTEDRRQKTEDRRQKTEDRRQKAEDRRQKAEDRRQKAEGRRRKAERPGKATQSHLKATTKPSTVEYRATPRPPEGYTKATPAAGYFGPDTLRVRSREVLPIL
jgi:hypothetical protein